MQGYWKLLVLTAEKLPKAVDPGVSRMEDPTAAFVGTHITTPGAGQAASKSNISSCLDVDDVGVQQGFIIERAPDWKHTCAVELSSMSQKTHGSRSGGAVTLNTVTLVPA